MSIPTGNLTSIGVGTCSAHRSTKSIVVIFAPGASTVLTKSSVTLNLSTVGVASCGHPAIPAAVSTTVLAETTGVHRQGDAGVVTGGTYIVASAEPTVLSG